MTLEELIQVAQDTDAFMFGEVREGDLIGLLLGEVEELKQANEKVQAYNDPHDRLNQIEEWGDIFFVLLAIARQKNIDLKQALSLTVIKLKDRQKQK